MKKLVMFGGMCLAVLTIGVAKADLSSEIQKLQPQDNGNPCWCECDLPGGGFLETQKEFNGPGRYDECKAECARQSPGSTSVCAV